MAELKTRATAADVEAFLARIGDSARREDCRRLVALMREATAAPPRLWGSSIVGFGDYHYRYATGREGDWFLAGFSPRKSDLSIYVSSGFEGHEELLARLGKHKTGKACLYVKRLADVDLVVLADLVRAGAEQLRRNPDTAPPP